MMLSPALLSLSLMSLSLLSLSLLSPDARADGDVGLGKALYAP